MSLEVLSSERSLATAALLCAGGLLISGCTHEQSDAQQSTHATANPFSPNEGTSLARLGGISGISANCHAVTDPRPANDVRLEAARDYAAILHVPFSKLQHATIGKVACAMPPSIQEAHHHNALVEVKGEHCLALDVDPKTYDITAFCPQ